jgi:endonuclease YncB( thermonuclease family)
MDGSRSFRHGPLHSRKAPLRGAFFVFAGALLFSAFCLAGDCDPGPEAQLVAVAKVIDGDTLRLEDGRLLRLIGIDTPELGRDGKPDQPFAREAKAALRRLVESAGRRILLRPGIDPLDRYRRTLGHAYAPRGQNLGAALLRQGVGFQAIVAPNLTHLACYQEAEGEARAAARGLWRDGVRDAAELTPSESGFHLLRGRVERVGRSRRAVWLNLEGGIAVRVPWSVWAELSEAEPESFAERRLEVRGWCYRHRGELRLQVSHPAAIRWL